ncbi:hypothetical protein Y1Q_0018933 [Alligator mississippiensis]|uniref:Uncharacterized protein n=1 Tax=Alligator mississippiensis TaxID=8496 RepID=A0A151M385_ALLMI|nr:hypothetical protein Y1Q_0018933 [Alligator mississippiensis]
MHLALLVTPLLPKKSKPDRKPVNDVRTDRIVSTISTCMAWLQGHKEKKEVWRLRVAVSAVRRLEADNLFRIWATMTHPMPEVDWHQDLATAAACPMVAQRKCLQLKHQLPNVAEA